MSQYSGAIVIPARNEAEYLPLLFEGLREQSDAADFCSNALVIVDNASTDGTGELAETYRSLLDNFDLHIIQEPDIGIRTACRTGFDFASLELGAHVIARLDADTVPMAGWYAALMKKFRNDPSAAIATGPTRPGLINETTRLDQLIVPIAKQTGHIIKAVRYRQPALLKFAPGYNMATTSKAYQSVGGFGADESLSEDVEFNVRIAEEYGWKSFNILPRMRVATSQRRVRTMGYIGAACFYYHDNNVRPTR